MAQCAIQLTPTGRVDLSDDRPTDSMHWIAFGHNQKLARLNSNRMEGLARPLTLLIRERPELASQLIDEALTEIEKLRTTLHRLRADSSFRVFQQTLSFDEITPHPYSPSYSGMCCEAIVMRGGGGDQCGLATDHEVHINA